MSKFYKRFIYSALITSLLLYAILLIGLKLHYNSEKIKIEKESLQKINEISNNSNEKIENYLQNLEQTSKNLSSVLENSELNNDETIDILKNLVLKSKTIFGLCTAYEKYTFDSKIEFYEPYIFKTGDSLTYINYDIFPENYFEKDWYKLAKEQNKSVWIEPYADSTAELEVMTTYSLPFYDKDNSLKGVITADIILNDFQKYINSLTILDSGYVYVFSENGIILAHPQNEYIYNENNKTLSEKWNQPIIEQLADSAKKNNSGVLKISQFFDDKNVSIYYKKLSSNWTSVIVLHNSELFKNLVKTKEISILTASITFFILITFLLIMNFIFQGILKNKRNEELENLVDARTNELQIQNQNLVYAEKELKSNLDELLAVEEELRQNNEELQTLNDNLFESEERYKKLIENQGEGFAVFDLNEKFIFVNNAGAKIFNLSSNDLISKSLKDFVNDKQYEIVKAQTKFRKRGENTSYELILNISEDEIRYIQVTGSPDYNTEDVLIGSIGIFRDITDLKIADQRLKEANLKLTKYFVAIEQSHATVLITNRAGKIEYTNPQFTKLTGYTFEEAKGKTPRVLKSGKTSKDTYENLWTTIINGEVWKGEFLNKKKDGTEFWEKAIISPVFNNEKIITNYIAIKEDITELKKAEQIIKNKTEQQQILLNNIPAFIFFKDLDLKYLMVNKSYANILNIPENEIIGKSDLDLVPYEIAEKYIKVDKQIIESRESILNFESLQIDNEGNENWASISKVPYFDNDGNIAGIVGIVLDITERKVNEQIIREKTIQFENTIINMADGYLKADFRGKFVNFNPTIVKEFGCESFEEVFATNIYDWIILSESEQKSFVTQLIRNKKVNNFSYQFKPKNRDLQFAELNAFVYYNKKGKPEGFEAIIRNVTEQKNHQQLLLNLNENLRQSFDTLQQQSRIIVTAHNKITESINYAKTIQDALLPSQNICDNLLNEHFILFKPKEIVSGDFYYIKKIENKLFVAVADCTGHGVAGGFMTVLSITFLDIILNQNSNYSAAEVLTNLRTRILNIFEQFGSDNRNGLDISLCIIEHQNNKLQFSGAYNSLFIISNNQLNEYLSVKAPVGYYPKEKDFYNTDIQLQTNDLIYMFSDGFFDQFGGDKIRKFGKKQAKEFLLEIKNLNLIEQKNLFDKKFVEWQGDEKQTDDVTVLGFKI